MGKIARPALDYRNAQITIEESGTEFYHGFPVYGQNGDLSKPEFAVIKREKVGNKWITYFANGDEEPTKIIANYKTLNYSFLK